jgi:hypothetical protein
MFDQPQFVALVFVLFRVGLLPDQAGGSPLLNSQGNNLESSYKFHSTDIFKAALAAHGANTNVITSVAPSSSR